MPAESMNTQPLHIDWYNSDDAQSFAVDGARWRLINRPRLWRPPTDVYETEESIVVRVEIGGMREEDFTISLEDRRLVIGGTRPDQSERRAFHQMEIPFGEFSTEIELSLPVIVERVEAVYRDGFLKIVLPKAKPHQIRIGE